MLNTSLNGSKVLCSLLDQCSNYEGPGPVPLVLLWFLNADKMPGPRRPSNKVFSNKIMRFENTTFSRLCHASASSIC